MKTKKLIAFLSIIIIAAIFTRCTNDKLGTPGTIQINAVSKSSLVKSASISTAFGEISLLAAVVEIQNLQIEENSGNDSEGNNQNENNDGGKDDGKESNSTEDDGGDILLTGPYVLDIVNGVTTIDAVEAWPGTYKKVNFDFVAGTENGGNSIVLSGNYTSSSGETIPFLLSSTFEANVQLPLVNGITVTPGSTAIFSIVFDVNSWLSGLNFANAAQANGTIDINPYQNISLYKSFIEAVSNNIDVED